MAASSEGRQRFNPCKIIPCLNTQINKLSKLMLYFRQDLEIAFTSWIVLTPETVSLSPRDKTWTIETKCHHALEEYKKDFRVVQEPEKNFIYQFTGSQGF